LTELFSKVVEISTTLPSQVAAEELARSLIEKKLAACVQIQGPIQSIYCWQNSIHQEHEFSLKMKTGENCLERTLNFIETQHPYELPEILWRTVHASAEYAAWVDRQSSG
jgi:periplasmic divalent cation tolerance protein